MALSLFVFYYLSSSTDAALDCKVKIRETGKNHLTGDYCPFLEEKVVKTLINIIKIVFITEFRHYYKIYA